MDLEEEIKNVKIDCIYFNGSMPCKPHREKGVHCENCSDYKKTNKKILIIQLGAAGEVLRNTPLLRKIKKEYSNSKIFWLTQYPELIPKDEVFKIYDYNQREVELLKDVEFDILYSLDKNEEMGALANQIKSKVKKGFSQKDGVVIPFDKDAERKWINGVFDDLMKENKKHYVEEIFEICGFKFNGEKYLLPDYEIPRVDLNRKKIVVALNTGARNKWKPREYSTKNWIEVAKLLMKKNYEVMAVGGEKEDENNKIIARESGAKYFGTFSRQNFLGLLSLSDIVLTSVSFGLHAAIGLEKKIVLLNNIFNKYEFYMYGNGKVLEPDLPCLMCYKLDFDDRCPVVPCMDLVKPEKIVKEVENFKLKRKDNYFIEKTLKKSLLTKTT